MSAVMKKAGNGTGAGAADAGYGHQMLPRVKVRPDAGQPRKTFDEAKLQALAVSIAERGIIQPLIVRLVLPKYTVHEPNLICKRWQIVDAAGVAVYEAGSEAGCRGQYPAADFESYWELIDGERRWRAAGMTKEPLDLVPCLVRRTEEVDERERYLLQHAANEGEPLNALEEAGSYFEAVQVRKLFTAEGLAQELGKSRSHVYGRLKLAALPAAVKEAVAKGELNAALAELVAKVPGEKNQLRAMKEILEGGVYEYDHESEKGSKVAMSVRKAKTHLREKYMLDLEEAVFDVKAKELLSGVPSCKECPLRTGNCTTLFPEIKNPNVCTDPDCHAKKVAAHLAAVRAEAERTGLTVLTERETKPLFSKYGGFDPYGAKTVRNLKDEVPGDKKKRSYQELLGKAAPAPVLAVMPDGKVEKFYQRELLEVALVRKGFSFKDPDKSEAQVRETPEQKAEKERLKKVREKLGETLLPKAKAAALKLSETEFLRLLAGFMMDGYGAEEAFKRVGAKCKMREDEECEVDIEASVRTMNVAALRELLVEYELDAEEDGVDYDGTFNSQFEALCRATQIDLGAEEKAAAEPAGKKVVAEVEKNHAAAKGMRLMTAAGRAKLAANARARWAKAQAAQKK